MRRGGSSKRRPGQLLVRKLSPAERALLWQNTARSTTPGAARLQSSSSTTAASDYLPEQVTLYDPTDRPQPVHARKPFALAGGGGIFFFTSPLEVRLDALHLLSIGTAMYLPLLYRSRLAVFR
jgi:hypothetical protein